MAEEDQANESTSEQAPTDSPGAESEPVEASKDDRNLAMLAHLLGIFTLFLGALIIWLIKKEQSPFVDDQGKEALNFQITLMIVYAALIFVSAITCGFGAILYLPMFVIAIVFCIIGAMKASDGQRYRYPVALRLIK